ncbi:MAG: ATP-binding protein [Elusimicrobiota bacterium]
MSRPTSWLSWLFSHRGIAPPQLEILTFGGLLVAGLALVTIDLEFRNGFRPAQYFCVVGLSLALLTLVGYGYGIRPLFYLQPSFDLMHLNIAITFTILNLGILCARPEKGFMALTISQGPGGSMVRMLLPAMIIIPTCLAAVRIAVSRTGFSDVYSSATVFSLANIVVFSILILWNASSLQRISAEQMRALQKIEAILFSINEGILMLDGQGRIQMSNRRLLELINIDPDQRIEGKSLREVMTESPLRESLLKACANPEANAFWEVNQSTDKNKLFLRITASPVVAPATGANLGVVASLGVVTAVRDATFERELDKMKEEFLQNITHDMRNPLTVVEGHLDFLLAGKRGECSPGQKSSLVSMKIATTTLLVMINNILDIAKINSSRIQVNLHSISLAGLAQHLVSGMQVLASLKGLTLALETAGDVVVAADARLLDRALTNLLGNAIKFTPSKGLVTVRVKDLGSEVEVQVEDTGGGVPPGDQDRLFKRFEQVAGQTCVGTGLGLVVTKSFVEAHRGRIWMESQVDKGSRFTFTIPKGLTHDQSGTVVVREAGALAPSGHLQQEEA